MAKLKRRFIIVKKKEPETPPSKEGVEKVVIRAPGFCWMCEEYCSSPSNGKKGERLCRISRKEVRGDQRSCKKFRLTKLFHCQVLGRDSATETCFNIRQKKLLGDKKERKLYKRCKKNCRQGKLIERMVKKMGHPITNSDRPSSSGTTSTDETHLINWGQIKRAIEAKGITNESQIFSIDIFCGAPGMPLPIKVGSSWTGTIKIESDREVLDRFEHQKFLDKREQEKQTKEEPKKGETKKYLPAKTPVGKLLRGETEDAIDVKPIKKKITIKRKVKLRRKEV